MKNPFVIFKIPAAIDIDFAELTVQYRTLVTNHHPDKGGDVLTMEDINTAYNILKYPIKRARALVELHGITITDEETLTDPTILEEIFELRMSNNKNLIHQKQQEAWKSFKEALVTCAESKCHEICHPREGGDPLTDHGSMDPRFRKDDTFDIKILQAYWRLLYVDKL